MNRIVSLIAGIAILAVGALPASAQSYRRHDSRQTQKDQWQGVAVAGSVVGLVGAATHNAGLAALGAAGAAYGAVRLQNEQDHDYRSGGYDRRPDYRRDRDGRDGRDGDNRNGSGRRDGRYGSGRYDDRRDGDYGRYDGRRSDDRRVDDRRRNDPRDGRRSDDRRTDRSGR